MEGILGSRVGIDKGFDHHLVLTAYKLMTMFTRNSAADRVCGRDFNARVEMRTISEVTCRHRSFRGKSSINRRTKFPEITRKVPGGVSKTSDDHIHERVHASFCIFPSKFPGKADDSRKSSLRFLVLCLFKRNVRTLWMKLLYLKN